VRTDGEGAAPELGRLATAFVAVMAVLGCVFTVVAIWAVIRLVLFYT
jgi:hypothetical protein